MTGIGSASLAKHRSGKRLTPVQAIHAKCADCVCDYADGRLNCGIPTCPLWPWMPYRNCEANGPNESEDLQ